MKILIVVLQLLVMSVPIALFSALFILTRRSASKSHPRQEGGALVFPLALAPKLLIVIVLVALILFSGLIALASSSAGGSPFVFLIPLSLFAAILLAMPRAVTVDHNGIRQTRWLTRDREIGWNEIDSVSEGARTGTVYVRSQNGGWPISFSPLLVGRPQFERELRSHAPHISIEN